MRSVDGHSLPISKVYLDQMAAALVIRQSFFADNPAEPQVQFKLEPYTSTRLSAVPSSSLATRPSNTVMAR